MSKSEYRKLPSVDELLRDDAVRDALGSRSRESVAEALRRALTCARESIARGVTAPSRAALVSVAIADLDSMSRMSLRRAINATGIIIHTGLGRAALSRAAQEAVADVAGGHSTLEIDVETGKRGSRLSHVSELLRELTGAPEALVVNNNAAAVLLAVNTLAKRREVLVSRGQLVEIGDSFRLPDIIRSAGAKLREVGTTNRTRLSDYADAIGPSTGLILLCHPSNFKISGFTESVAQSELARLGKGRSVPVMDDLGSGAFVDVARYGLESEPTVGQSVAAGADMVSFSGDKLLGASQSGIIVGSADYVEKCRRNPMFRALRADKLTLAALEATLRSYVVGDSEKDIPVLAALARKTPDIEKKARFLADAVDSLRIRGLKAEVIACVSETGGGSLPGQSLESRAVALQSDRYSADDLGRHFRKNAPPIFGRITRDRFLLDMRTVADSEVDKILACVRGLAR